MNKGDSFKSVCINTVLLRRCNFIEVVPVDFSWSLSLVVTRQASTLMCQDKTSRHRICEGRSYAMDKRDRYNASFTVPFWGIGGGVSATRNNLRQISVIFRDCNPYVC
jgi:hypothetical protein